MASWHKVTTDPSYEVVIIHHDPDSGVVEHEIWTDERKTRVAVGMAASMDEALSGAEMTAEAHRRARTIMGIVGDA